MFEDPAIEAALYKAARRNNVDAKALQQAVEHESAQELALVLTLTIADAQQCMARVQRILTFTSDWGAGCRLLTDDIRAELVEAFDAW